MSFALRVFVFLVMSAFSSLPSAQGQTPPPREDNQSWNEIQVIKPLSKNTDFMMIGVLRIGRDFGRPVDERIGAGVALKLNRHLTLMPTYLYIEQQPYAGFRIREHRIVFNATAKFNWKQFTLTDRNLLERRVRQASGDFTVYRNRLQIDHPARLGAFKFKPFVADEIWYSTQPTSTGQQGWFRNRISVGIIKQFGERYNAEFFYLRQSDGILRPGNVHALGTLFRIFLSK